MPAAAELPGNKKPRQFYRGQLWDDQCVEPERGEQTGATTHKSIRSAQMRSSDIFVAM